MYATLHCNLASFHLYRHERSHILKQEGVHLPSFTNYEPNYEKAITAYKTASGILNYIRTCILSQWDTQALIGLLPGELVPEALQLTSQYKFIVF